MLASPFPLLALCVLTLTACAPRSRWIEPQGVPGPVHRIGDGPQQSAQPVATFDVVTYNVAGLPACVAKTKPRETHPKMGGPLGAFDLVLLQEDFWYHRLIQTRHGWRVRPRRGAVPRLGDGLARFSHLPLGRVEHVTWSTAHGILHHYNDQLAAKGFAVGTVELQPGGFVFVYNVHFDAGGHKGDRLARVQQRAQLQAHVARHVPHSAALIVAGDFNCGPSHLSELMEGAGLLDAGVGGIDRVLYRSGWAITLHPTATDAACVEASDALRGLSDHSPVSVRFEVTAR